jgi:hypothetical protein
LHREWRKIRSRKCLRFSCLVSATGQDNIVSDPKAVGAVEVDVEVDDNVADDAIRRLICSGIRSLINSGKRPSEYASTSSSKTSLSRLWLRTGHAMARCRCDRRLCCYHELKIQKFDPTKSSPNFSDPNCGRRVKCKGMHLPLAC